MRVMPIIIVLFSVISLSATAGCAAEDGDQNPETSTPTPTTTVVVPSLPTPFTGLPLPSENADLFSTSGACTSCHAHMIDESANDVSTDTLWRATMMANAARDPYWQASVRAEVLTNPALGDVIEDKCATCHMPMARFTAIVNEQETNVLDTGFLSSENDLHVLAMDGVSCTLCHQIEADGFGQATSFSGGFVIDPDLPTGERLNFGIYPVDERQTAIMQGASGFIPVESIHVTQSELCATCHTLYTPYVDAQGNIVGEFPEQMAYFEWLNSDYRNNRSCQNCHMPEAAGGVRLSITGGELRNPFARHVFVGGNAYVLNLMSYFGEEMGATASTVHFQNKIGNVTEQLEYTTATIALEETVVSNSRLMADVVITNNTGHKFPTGFPSRRAWIHFSVYDSSGQLISESGAPNPDGSIAGNDNDVDPTHYEEHHQSIESPDQVQIYESIMIDTDGRVTTTLLFGSGYIKDNRLLPLGFDKNVTNEDIAVKGQASNDENFVGGSNRIHYDVDLGESQGPFTIEVELLYQSIGYRWAENLRTHQAPEVARFIGYYDAVPNLPIVVASETAYVET